MKTNLLYLYLVMLLAFTACEKDDKEVVPQKMDPVKIEAESDSVVITGNCYVDSQGEGWSGTGFVGGIDLTEGNALTFTVNMKNNKTCKLDFRYSNGTDNSKLRLHINNIDKGDLDFPRTGEWDITWGTVTTSVELNAGINTIMIEYASNGPADIDYIEIYEEETL